MSNDPADKPILLAVDDDPDSLSLISDILEQAGITTLVARSGRAALKLLERVKPDGILMDAVMPDLDGFETCIRIKKRPEWAKVPLIFMTGLSDTEDIVRGFRAGGVDYITKPFNAEVLTARILAHVATARMAQSARTALDISGAPLIAVSNQGVPTWWNAPAGRLLSQVVPDWDPAKDIRPLSISDALAALIQTRAATAAISDGLREQVVAKYVGATGPGEHLVELRRSAASETDTAERLKLLQAAFGLTNREAETLLWITRGKTNRDIAEIIDCSPRTINKHLEQVYSKLNVENRTAAAMEAVRVLGEV